MKRHSLGLMGFVLLAVAGGLHYWFNARKPRPDGEHVETVGQMCALIDRRFHHDGEPIQVVKVYLEYPYNQVDFITSAEQVGRLEELRGKRVRFVTTRHEGRNGRLVSAEETP